MRYTPDAILDPSQVEVIRPFHAIAPSMVVIILAALMILILMSNDWQRDDYCDTCGQCGTHEPGDCLASDQD